MLRASAMPQQRAIAARNHSEAVLDEIHGCVAECRGFPWIGGDAIFSEQYVGDFAVGRAIGAAVDGLQHVPCTPSALRRQARIWRDRASQQRSEEPCDSLKAIVRVGIERNKGREPLPGGRARQAE